MSVGPSRTSVIRELSFITLRSQKEGDFVQTCPYSPGPALLTVPFALKTLAPDDRPVNSTQVPSLPDRDPKAAECGSQSGFLEIKRTVMADSWTVWAECLSTCSDKKQATYGLIQIYPGQRHCVLPTSDLHPDPSQGAGSATS